MGHMPNNEWDDDKPDVWHEYRCTRCKFAYMVPDFAMDRPDLKPGEAPAVACPRCGRPMKIVNPNEEATNLSWG